jgi:hypothetical protein
MRKTILLLALAAVLAAPAALAQSGSVSRFPGKTSHAPPPTAEERLRTQDAAGKAQLLREADLATRKAFAVYQAALAKAKDKGKAPGADAVLALDAALATRAQVHAVADDMTDAGLALQDATNATRTAFQKFTYALDDQKALERAAGAEARIAAFGVDVGASTE